MSKNVAVFVDVANIFYAAKAAGVDIDYVTLLKSATAGRDFIRAYAYTGLDPENENQRQFQNFLGRNGYKVVSKDIRKYGDGKVKANLDIELVVDLMKTARNVDIAVVVSGDGDFAPAIRAVQEMGVRVEVISFRGNTSSDLIDVADQFTDITQLAKVERSTRSGRRVPAAEADLSMTAVPDKETEGAPRRRRRTTKVAVAEPGETPIEAPVATARAATARTATARTAAPRVPPASAARSAAEAIAAAGVTTLRVLPGERLSRAAGAAKAGEGSPTEAAQMAASHPEAAIASGAAAAENAPVETAPDGAQPIEGNQAEHPEAETRRRRRRRGGRGRGRGRGRELEAMSVGEAGTEPFEGEEQTAPGPSYAPAPSYAHGPTAAPYAPFRPPQSTFGSVWDSQLGMNVPTRQLPAQSDTGEQEEEIEEPEIPEYLLAERRRSPAGRGGRGRGGRGRAGRGAYAAALDRERFGRSAAPPAGWSPDRGPGPRRRGIPSPAPARPPAYQRAVSAEPWSEVPPEVEELIRAQLAGGRPTAPSVPAAPAGEPAGRETAAAEAAVAEPTISQAAGTRRRTSATGQRRSTRAAKAASDGPAPSDAGTGSQEGTAPLPRTRRASPARPSASEPGAEAAEGSAVRSGRARSRRTARSGTVAAEASALMAETGTETPKPRTRTRKSA